MTRRGGIRLGGALLLGGMLAALPSHSAWADPDTQSAREQRAEDFQRARALREAGEIVPFGVILEHTREHHPGRVINVKFEDEDGLYRYELEVLDPQGVVWALLFDARTGQLVETMEESEEIRRDKQDEPAGGGPAGDGGAGDGGAGNREPGDEE